jgi:NTE family protein
MLHRTLILLIALPCLLLRVYGSDEERPKIGVVLGGGGALGFAHVGVLQVLEENRVPVDYIAGTSMGSIVAGMYASGMSPAEIEKSFLELDWWDVLRDQSPHRYLDYRQKIENRRYLVEFGLQRWKPVYPPGMSYGQKLNNVLGTFALNSTGIYDFDQLNIPYRAVATDLYSGTSVVLDSGNLAKAMRASMAVPGVFTPVRMDGMVLVDGGILNNIPVDVAKDMGADIVFAVDVGASSAEKSLGSDYTSLGDVVGRTYVIMQRPEQERQLARADVVIAPDLSDASSSQFHHADKIIPAGRDAAEALLEKLKPYAVSEAAYTVYLERQRRKRSRELTVAAVKVDGNESVSTESIRERIHTKEGPLNLPVVYEDLNRIHGMGHFQTVTFELTPDHGGYILDYNTHEKFWGPTYLNMGMKVEASTDTSMLWSILLNYTRALINPLGGEVRIGLEGGGHIRRLDAEWYQPVNRTGRLFLAPSVTLYSENIDFYIDNVVAAIIDEELIYGRLDAGISGFEYGEARIGILGGFASADGNIGPITLDRDNDSVVAATTSLRLDQRDDPIFAKSGCFLSLDGTFAFEEVGSSETYSTLEGELVLPFTLGKNTFTPRLAGGSSLGTDLPFYALFHVGGLDGFAGYAPYQIYGNYYGIGSISHRYEMARLPPTFGGGIYTLLRFDAGNAWFNSDDIDIGNLNYGGLAGLEADTRLGKCSIAVGKAESVDPRFYFSIGNSF